MSIARLEKRKEKLIKYLHNFKVNTVSQLIKNIQSHKVKTSRNDGDFHTHWKQLDDEGFFTICNFYLNFFISFVLVFFSLLIYFLSLCVFSPDFFYVLWLKSLSLVLSLQVIYIYIQVFTSDQMIMIIINKNLTLWTGKIKLKIVYFYQSDFINCLLGLHANYLTIWLDLFSHANIFNTSKLHVNDFLLKSLTKFQNYTNKVYQYP